MIQIFDKNIDKKMWILCYQIPIILQQNKKNRRKQLETIKESGIMPKVCFEKFRIISYADKIYLYNMTTRVFNARL